MAYYCYFAIAKTVLYPGFYSLILQSLNQKEEMNTLTHILSPENDFNCKKSLYLGDFDLMLFEATTSMRILRTTSQKWVVGSLQKQKNEFQVILDMGWDSLASGCIEKKKEMFKWHEIDKRYTSHRCAKLDGKYIFGLEIDEEPTLKNINQTMQKIPVRLSID